MRQILSRSLLTVAAASSILAVTGGYASADSDAQGGASNSPGLLSGNSLQAPVDVPVNACGNSVNAVGVGNAAMGNGCANTSPEHHRQHHAHAPAAHARPASQSAHPGSATADGVTRDSPGVLSGNSLDIPLNVPVDACGNTVDAVGLLNTVSGNSCGDGDQAASSVSVPGPRDGVPPTGSRLPPDGRVLPPGRAGTPPAGGVTDPLTGAVTSAHADRSGFSGLAETGASGGELGAAAATSAALLLGGAMLYRRGARTSRIQRTYS